MVSIRLSTIIALVIAVILSIFALYITTYIQTITTPTPPPSTSPSGEEFKTPGVPTNITIGTEIFLPMPRIKGNISLEEALSMRRSIRDYKPEPLTIEQLSQLLWAAQGINEVVYGFRTAPSAGATYPLEVYVVVGENGVKGLPAGIYHYNVHRHSLTVVKLGDFRDELARAALNQPWIRNAAIDIVITAVYERTTKRYGERGIRYVHMEVGHVGQNIYLQAAALGLGTVAVGAFYDDEVRKIIGAPENEHPLYIMPVGVPVKLYKLKYEDLIRYYESQRLKTS